MKFYTEEITVMVDGTSAVAITEKATDIEARSSFHQIMASAMINENVASIHAEAKNSVGGIYESATWENESIVSNRQPDGTRPTR